MLGQQPIQYAAPTQTMFVIFITVFQWPYMAPCFSLSNHFGPDLPFFYKVLNLAS